jgi:tellurite resistance protein
MPFLHYLPVEELRPAAGWEKDGETASTVDALASFVAAADGMFDEDTFIRPSYIIVA